MSDYQDVGHCKVCKFQWVAKEHDTLSQRKSARRDSAKPGSLQCPACGSNQIRIEKEYIGE